MLHAFTMIHSEWGLGRTARTVLQGPPRVRYFRQTVDRARIARWMRSFSRASASQARRPGGRQSLHSRFMALVERDGPEALDPGPVYDDNPSWSVSFEPCPRQCADAGAGSGDPRRVSALSALLDPDNPAGRARPPPLRVPRPRRSCCSRRRRTRRSRTPRRPVRTTPPTSSRPSASSPRAHDARWSRSVAPCVPRGRDPRCMTVERHPCTTYQPRSSG